MLKIDSLFVNYINSHLLTIKHSYSKYPYFDKFYLRNKIYKNNNKLIDLNLSFIFLIVKFLKLDEKKIYCFQKYKLTKNFQKTSLFMKFA